MNQKTAPLSIIFIILAIFIVGCNSNSPNIKETSHIEDNDNLVAGNGKKQIHTSDQYQYIDDLTQNRVFVYTLNADEFIIAYRFDLPSSSSLRIAYYSSEFMHFYILSEDELKKYKNGEEYNILYGGENLKEFGSKDPNHEGFSFKEGSYAIVIESLSYHSHRPKYRLEVEKI